MTSHIAAQSQFERSFTRARHLFIVGIATLMIAGCASKSYIVLLESPDGTTGKVVINSLKGEQILDKARQGAALDGSAPVAFVNDDKLTKDFGQAMAAQPKLPVRYLLYFREDIQLTNESEALIPKIIAEAADWPAVDVSVIGHTDTIASDGYNEQLGLRRATAIVELLRTKGIKFHALTVESHGMHNLLVPTPPNTREPMNRRVEVSIR